MRLECRLSAEGRNSRQSTVALFRQPAALSAKQRRLHECGEHAFKQAKKERADKRAKRLG